MKAEINNENKVKFFALYWGQEVFLNPILSIEPVKNIYLFNYDVPEDIDLECLILKPLSSIIDKNKNSILEFAEKVIPVSETYATVFSIDHLRSKGYAVPWMGLSVEEMAEAGWIKLLKP